MYYNYPNSHSPYSYDVRSNEIDPNDQRLLLPLAAAAAAPAFLGAFGALGPYHHPYGLGFGGAPIGFGAGMGHGVAPAGLGTGFGHGVAPVGLGTGFGHGVAPVGLGTGFGYPGFGYGYGIPSGGFF